MATDVHTDRVVDLTTEQTRPTAFGGLETSSPLTDAQIDGIARALVGQLTLEEKVEMMSGGHDFFQGMLHFSSAGYKRYPLTNVGPVPRLGIPGLRFTDGPRGVMFPGRPPSRWQWRAAPVGTPPWKSESETPWDGKRGPTAPT